MVARHVKKVAKALLWEICGFSICKSWHGSLYNVPKDLFLHDTVSLVPSKTLSSLSSVASIVIIIYFTLSTESIINNTVSLQEHFALNVFPHLKLQLW